MIINFFVSYYEMVLRFRKRPHMYYDPLHSRILGERNLFKERQDQIKKAKAIYEELYK
jgi:hypothetical protein